MRWKIFALAIFGSTLAQTGDRGPSLPSPKSDPWGVIVVFAAYGAATLLTFLQTRRAQKTSNEAKRELTESTRTVAIDGNGLKSEVRTARGILEDLELEIRQRFLTSERNQAGFAERLGVLEGTARQASKERALISSQVHAQETVLTEISKKVFDIERTCPWYPGKHEEGKKGDPTP